MAVLNEIAGITRANEGIQGISWNILGQTYVPKNRTEHCFSWHALFPPGTYAMQGYDTALLIDSAVKAVKGDLSNKEAVAAALKKADFTSLRGTFKFNANGYPIQDFYLTKVAKRADGKFQTEIVQKVFENYGDSYAKDCVGGN